LLEIKRKSYIFWTYIQKSTSSSTDHLTYT
jgi:hypothetical protein